MHRTLPVALLLAGLSGCGPRTPATSPVPVDLAELEARRAANAGNPEVLTDVGVAFYGAGQFARARDVLSAALALAPKDTRAIIHLGLAYEGLAEPDLALDSYRRALTLPVSRAEREGIDGRLAALTRQALAASARRAIASEATLATRSPVPNSVAVLPWTFLGGDPSLEPLSRGLAHLVVTDLARISRLTLVERDRVQALTDELALSGAGRTDSVTAARSGRLLGVAEVVQGAYRETASGDLRLDANVVTASNAAVRATGSASDRLARLFALEKEVVFELLDRWGIAITPAERREISEQPTADLQAFLAFSKGLEAEDRGDFGAASVMFRDAARIDPSFRAAMERSVRTARVGASPPKPSPSLALAAAGRTRAPAIRSAQLGAALQNIAPTLAGRFGRVPAKAAITFKSRLAEALRQDDATRLRDLTTVTGTIPRP